MSGFTLEERLLVAIFGEGAHVAFNDHEADLIRKAAARGYRHTPKRVRSERTHPKAAQR